MHFEESFKANKIRIESKMENYMNKGVNIEVALFR